MTRAGGYAFGCHLQRTGDSISPDFLRTCAPGGATRKNQDLRHGSLLAQQDCPLSTYPMMTTFGSSGSTFTGHVEPGWYIGNADICTTRVMVTG